MVSSLEKIDDDLDKNGVTLVKLAADNPDNDMERLQIDELPAIVFYDNKFPTTFKGTERSPCDFFGVRNFIFKRSIRDVDKTTAL